MVTTRLKLLFNDKIVLMKNHLHFFFTISIALLLSGMAGSDLRAEPCPMKAAHVALMEDVNIDCCNDMKSHSEQGKACKPGQECKTGGMLQVSILKLLVSLFSPVAISFFSDSLPVQTPSGVWRPPRV